MATYIKPNGTELEVNDTSADYAKKLGWKLKAAKAAPKATKDKPPVGLVKKLSK